eukprot:CAMPEP_0182572426 /NCGR_PEP_ID=MMETSP1324-20130603/16516_1 /TAXON_ID=236786 /ORGANISM="Florenciella sp., Strain RCC1587" /LENGTH=47 /DNA_ID= /DNA_START= /DNA_END= /DNA_ORIENTATION=
MAGTCTARGGTWQSESCGAAGRGRIRERRKWNYLCGSVLLLMEPATW